MENNCTLEKLGKYCYVFRPSCSQNFIFFQIYGYKLSSHADRSEVEEGQKGCSILFCQNL